MTIPNYLTTFRRAVRELEGREISEKSPTLASLNSLISHPPTSKNIEGTIPEGREVRNNQGASGSRLSDASSRPRTCEKSEVSEKRGGGFAHVLNALERRCPDYVEPYRWQQCVEDAQRFLATWGDRALALGWTSTELFGLNRPPAKPHPSYSRLSCYDATGLLWLLQGRRAVALTADLAAIQSPNTGNVLTYRRTRKPAYGPLGDLLDDFTA